jgi:crossover junction endodeoxyribonuclease RuvC
MSAAPVSWIGIDPGLGGAVVALRPEGSMFHVERTPVVPATKGRTQHNVAECSRLLRDMMDQAIANDWEPRVAIEDVHSIPGQGVASMFSFGVGFGLWLGITAALKLPTLRIAPKGWQRLVLAGRPRRDIKQTAVLAASELWPSLRLRTKADSGMADAALIAEAARRVHAHGGRPAATTGGSLGALGPSQERFGYGTGCQPI